MLLPEISSDLIEKVGYHIEENEVENKFNINRKHSIDSTQRSCAMMYFGSDVSADLMLFGIRLVEEKDTSPLQGIGKGKPAQLWYHGFALFPRNKLL